MMSKESGAWRIENKGEKRDISRLIFYYFSLITLQKKIPLYKVFEMLFRKSAMQSQIIFQMPEK